MQYILLLNVDETRWTKMSHEEAERETGAYMAYRKALQEAGAFVGGNRLQPSSSATTVRVTSDGKSSVLDGPFAETKEQLGGYFLIDVANLDEAIAWAARCPAASHGTVEVRAIAPVPALV
jgi:hypothetical protein